MKHSIREEFTPGISPQARGSHKSIGAFTAPMSFATNDIDIVNDFKKGIDPFNFHHCYRISITDSTKERVMSYMGKINSEQAETGQSAYTHILAKYKTEKAVHTLEDALLKGAELTPAEEQIVVLAHFPENFENMIYYDYEQQESDAKKALFRKAIHKYTLEYITERVKNPEKQVNKSHKRVKQDNEQNATTADKTERSKEFVTKMRALLDKNSRNRTR